MLLYRVMSVLMTLNSLSGPVEAISAGDPPSIISRDKREQEDLRDTLLYMPRNKGL